MEIGYVDSESEVFVPKGKGEWQRKLIFYQLAQVKAQGQGKFETLLIKYRQAHKSDDTCRNDDTINV